MEEFIYVSHGNMGAHFDTAALLEFGLNVKKINDSCYMISSGYTGFNVLSTEVLSLSDIMIDMEPADVWLGKYSGHTGQLFSADLECSSPRIQSFSF